MSKQHDTHQNLRIGRRGFIKAGAAGAVAGLGAQAIAGRTAMAAPTRLNAHRTLYKTVQIDGLDIFYRAAGPKDAPTILLLHGFPTSSHMFRNLIPALADEFHLIAPDYPGYGNSSMPTMDKFHYTFDRMAVLMEKFTDKLALERYSLYLMDYGAPVGFRLAAKYPERVEILIVQNGNAYEEGLRDFWNPIKAYWKAPTPENEVALRGLRTIDATKW